MDAEPRGDLDPDQPPRYRQGMRSSDADILFVPGRNGSGPDHWQSRWEAKLSTGRRVEQDDWNRPDAAAWTGRLIEAVRGATRGVVLVAHDLGVVGVVRAAPLFPPGQVRGAYLVALPDIESRAADGGFGPIPREPLPFRSLLVASRTDPACAYARAEHFAAAWGAGMVDAGDSGHIDAASGYGPWPEGLMRFAGFLKGL